LYEYLKKSFFSFLLLPVIIIFLTSSCQNVKSHNQSSSAEKGIIDLRNWNFQKNGPVNLKGQWEFYWKKHIPPNEFMNKDPDFIAQYIYAPGIWNNFIKNGEKISGQGFATYRLRVLSGKNKRFLSLKLLDMATAFRVYVNGDLLVSNGIPGETAEQTTPFYAPTVVTFENTSEAFDIIIHVSNFHHWQGGMWEPILLGNPSQLNSMREKQLVISSFLFGTICIMGFYHIGLFWSRQKDKYSLYFGLFCLLIAIRIITTGERYIVTLLPAIDYLILIKIIYLSFYICVLFFLMYSSELFRGQVSPKIVKIVKVTCLIFSILVLFTTPRFFTRTMPVYQILTLLFLLYGIITICFAVLKKQQGALVFLAGFLILAITTVNDILYARQIITTGHFVPFGLFIFIFSQSFIISQRFSKAFITIEKQSMELKGGILEKQRIENHLKKSEEKYRTILESIEEAYYEVDIAGNLTFFNSSLSIILGYSEDELMGMNNRQYLDEENARKVFIAYNLVYKTKNPYKAFDWELIRKDGSRGYVETSVSLRVNSKGREIGFRGIVRDITKQRKIEAQLVQAQKMESVGRLAGGVAHDYNNALSVIMGYTELAMANADPTGPLQADLNEVLKAGRRATDITRQLLAFARKQTIAPIVLDLNESVENMLKMLRRLIGEDIDLAWLPMMDLGNIKMDPSQIDQILANLCVNARDAIKGVGQVTIETKNMVFDEAYCADHTGFSPGKFVLLAVSDNGCGMDKEILNNIFEPFFTTKDLYKGTGLGLSMVYGIVKQNKGFINVYSEQDKGTTINIYLPLNGGKPVVTQEEITQKSPHGSGETILVVEDDLPILELTQKILSGLGYTVLVSDTPKGAMRLAKEHTGEIILLVTDMIMPEMNGLELANSLQLFYPDLKLLFMSGYTANAIAHHGVLDKGVHFIQKPFSKNELAKIVRKVLNN